MTNPADPDTPTATLSLMADDVATWVDRYLAAWTTNDAVEIAALFTEDGEYRESPYTTEWIGRGEIVEGWRSRWDWQQGGWSFEWTLVSLDGRTAVITGIGRYAKLGDFDNHWTVTFGTPDRVTSFVMINTEREQ